MASKATALALAAVVACIFFATKSWLVNFNPTPPGPWPFFFGHSKSTATAGLLPPLSALEELPGTDILSWAQWPLKGMRFAALNKDHSFNQILAQPNLQTGALVLILPGSKTDRSLRRRDQGEPWISLAPNASTRLAAALSFDALEAAAEVLEAKLLQGRRLHPFRVETAEMQLCRGRGGACAVWEVSSGRLVVDDGLIGVMASAPGLPKLLSRFVGNFAAQLAAIAPSIASPNSWQSSENTGCSNDTAHAQKQDEAPGSGKEGYLLHTMAESAVKAATAALTLLMAAQLPLWWCLACPLVLGLLAPFIFNFGLTAAAEELCATMQLPDDTCADLWWGAFALALVLSLGAAVPVVYVCHLKDCGRRALGGICGSG